MHNVPLTATHTLNMWNPVTVDDVYKLIQSACNKTCRSDPAPTWLKKFGWQLPPPFIVRLLNESSVTGCFPAKFKHAIVLPLLQK